MVLFPALLAVLTQAASLAQALQENAVGTAFDLNAVTLTESQATDFDFAWAMHLLPRRPAAA